MGARGDSLNRARQDELHSIVVAAAVSAAILERSKALQFIRALSLMTQGETNPSF